MNRTEMIARMEAILAAAEAAQRALSVEEQAEFDELKTKVDTLDAGTSAANAMQARRDEVAARRVAPQAATPTVAAPAAGNRQVPMRGAEVKEFSTLAEFCTAAIYTPNDQRLASLFRRNVEQNAEQRMDSGQSGGFMIPTQFREAIMKVNPQTSIIRPRATVIPAGDPPDAEIELPALDQTGTAPQNVYGGVSVAWLAEGGAKPETDADFRMVSLKPQEIAGHIVLTDKLLRNSAATGAFVASQLPLAIQAAEDLAFLRGNGIGKPKGVIGNNAEYAQARATGNTVTYADTVNMLSRLMGGAGVWVANPSLLPVLAQIQDNAGGTGVGQYVFAQGNMQGGIPDTLWGRPILWNQRSPALGSKGDLVLADFSHYLIKDGSGPFIAYSEHVFFLSNKTVVKAFTNVDGNSWLTEPFRGEDNRQTSPFVVLAA